MNIFREWKQPIMCSVYRYMQFLLLTLCLSGIGQMSYAVTNIDAEGFKELLNSPKAGDYRLTEDVVLTQGYGKDLAANISIDGDGHTVTFNYNNFTTSNKYGGFYCVVQAKGGLCLNNIDIEINGTIQSTSSSYGFGGIVGEVLGNANLNNVNILFNGDMSITKANSSSPLIGCCVSGNVVMDNVRVSGVGTFKTGANYSGGFLGFASGMVSLKHCYLTGIQLSGNSAFGGVLGLMEVETTEVELEDVHVSTGVSGTGYVGGIVGIKRTGANLKMTDCFFEGDVVSTYTSTSVRKEGCVGGLIGYDGAAKKTTVLECCRVGSADAPATIWGNDYRGGLIGYIEGSDVLMEGCKVYASLYLYNVDKKPNPGKNNVGGFIGSNSGTVIVQKGPNGEANLFCGTIGGNKYVGGIIGYGNATLKNITVSSSFILGDESVGGLIGYNTAKSTISDCEVSNSVLEAKGASDSNLGGVVGQSTKEISLKNVHCVNTTIQNLTQAKPNIGGVIGKSSQSVTATDCSFTGKIAIKETTQNSIGGFVGSGGGTFTRCTVGAQETIDATTISGTNDGMIYGTKIGGFLGATSGNVTMKDCAVYASINTKASTTSQIGGMIGYASSTVTMDGCQYMGGNIKGYESVGGLIGHLHQVKTNYTCDIKKCTIGDIDDRIEVGYISTDKKVSDIGGVVGVVQSGYEVMVVDSKVNAVDVLGTSNLGGFIGNVNNQPYFKGCEFGGRVTAGQLLGVSESCAGGFVGLGTGEFIDCMVTNDAVIKAAANSVGGFIGKTPQDASQYVWFQDGCTVNCDIDNATCDSIGGFVGFSQCDLTVDAGCVFNGNLTGGKAVGGYVGKSTSTNTFGSWSEVLLLSDSEGPVTITGTGSTGGLIGAGGIITIANAEVPVNVTVESTENGAGGFVGNVPMTKNNKLLAIKCVNRGNVNAASVAAGGIVGYAQNETNVYDCHNYGNVEMPAVTAKSQQIGMGGIVGRASGKTSLQYCSNEEGAAITGLGGVSVGGIIGRSTNADFLISDCYNKGAVTTKGKANGGGVIGILNGGTVQFCYNRGTARYNNADGTGLAYGFMSKGANPICCYSNYFTTNSYFGNTGDGGIVPTGCYYRTASDKATTSLNTLGQMDLTCFNSGRVAYALEMSHLAYLQSQDETVETLAPEDIHFVQDLEGGDEYPELIFTKPGCYAYPDEEEVVELLVSNPSAIVMSLTEEGKKYAREHIVYNGVMLHDAHDKSATEGQALTFAKSAGDYFNLADNGDQTFSGKKHTDKWLTNANRVNYGTSANNYMKFITGAIEPTGDALTTNSIFEYVDFAGTGIQAHRAAKAGKMLLTDAALVGKSAKDACVPYNLYLPVDVTVENGNMEYHRKVSSQYLTLDIPFSVGRIEDANGNDVTDKMLFGTLKGYTNEKTPDVNVELKSFSQFAEGYVPAGAYICEYSGAAGKLTFKGSAVHPVAKATYCPKEYLFSADREELPEPMTDDGGEECYSSCTDGSGDVALLGYTTRYIVNSANWEHYYFLSKGLFYGGATQGGVFTPSFRSMLYFKSNVGPMALPSSAMLTLNYFNGDVEDEEETTVITVADLDASEKYVDVYDQSGRMLRNRVAAAGALDGLKAGVYIVDGIKLVK